jgi:hypothetical protein
MPATPAFSTITQWREISDIGRSRTYELLGTGELRTIKFGRSILIDAAHGLAYLRSLPAAQIKPRTTPRHRNAAEATPDVARRSWL